MISPQFLWIYKKNDLHTIRKTENSLKTFKVPAVGVRLAH